MPSVPARTTTLAAASDKSRTVASSQFFLKDGRKIRVGDCALFKPPQGTTPPFIGIIRRLSSDSEDRLSLGVNWLYRPAEVELGKGSLLEAAPNELFYSFHWDVIPAASLLHPCKVAFLPKGAQLPIWISSFVCMRVYDTTNKYLWWLTDKDYTNVRQEEVDQLIEVTRAEMHAQTEGHSPKPLKTPSDSLQNKSTLCSSVVKGKKRARVDEGSEPIKLEGHVKTCDVDIHHLRSESMLKSEMDKLTNKGGLVDYKGVEKLLQLMQLDKTASKLDVSIRTNFADVLASTDRFEFLGHFVQLRGLSVLNEWLQDVHKGKISDSSTIKESDKCIEDFLFTLLRALEKLPVNLHALQHCNVGKSVNNLRSHKNLDIQKKARSLVDTWKKRVEAEMKIIDAKSASSQVPGYQEGSLGGNRHTDSSFMAPAKSSVTESSAYKTVPVKLGPRDGPARSSMSPRSAKASNSLSVAFSSKDLKESSSSSSQSQQSCSSEHIKTLGSEWKEDARSSTAISPITNKISSSASRRRRSSNCILTPVSGVQKDISPGKAGFINRGSTSEKVVQSRLVNEKTLGSPVVDQGNSQRLIVRLTNPARCPAQRSTNPSVVVTRVSSPEPSKKHEQYDQKVKGMSDSCQTVSADVDVELWQSKDLQEGLTGSDDGDLSPSTALDKEECRSGDENGRPMDSSKAKYEGVFSNERKSEGSGNATLSYITALIESCMKDSEISACIPAGDGINLLASVAAGEMSISDHVSPVGSHGGTHLQEDTYTSNESKSRLVRDEVSPRHKGKADDGACADTKKQIHLISPGPEGRLHVVKSPGPEGRLHVGKSSGPSADMPQSADSCSKSHGELDGKSAAVSAAASTAVTDEAYARCDGNNQGDDERKVSSNKIHGVDEQDWRPQVKTALSDESKTRGNTDEKTVDSNLTVVSVSVRDSNLEACDTDNEVSNVKREKESSEEPSLCPSIEIDAGFKKHAHKQLGGGFPKEHRLPPNALNLPEDVNECTNNVILPCSDSVSNQAGLNDIKSEKAAGWEAIIPAEKRQTKYIGHKCNVIMHSDGGTGAGDHKGGGGKSMSEREEISEQCPDGLVFHEELCTSPDRSVLHEELPPSPQEETCMKSSGSEVSAVEVAATEECGSNEEASSGSIGLEKAKKLDFDLNESFPVDDGSQGDSDSSTAPGCISSVHLPIPCSYPVSSMSGTFTGLITVSAAKGPFVPPENLMRSTVELGWRGSAATSAFRRAEPRKVFELPLSAADLNPSPVNKQRRPPLDFDLNVLDEGDSKDMNFQGSANKVGSGLDLDLNRVDEGSDMEPLSAKIGTTATLEVPLFPGSLSSFGVLPTDGMISRKNFDLNNGPCRDDVGSAPVRHAHHVQSSIPPPPLVGDFRMSNAELGTISWPPPCNSYPAVDMPSIFPEREQPYSRVATAGQQGRLRPVSGSSTLGPDIYQGPVFPSAPAFPFSPSNPFSYPGFPFNSSVSVPSASFSGASAPYLDSSSAGGLCFPAFPSHVVGHAGAVSVPYLRPYVFNVSDGSVNVGADRSRKWVGRGLDLNAGPGSTDKNIRDERFPPISMQYSVANSNTPLEEHMRLKRKDPEGGRDTERFGYKQPSWQ